MSPRTLPRRAAMSALLGVALAAAVPATGRAADLTATPANLASVFAGARAGDVIHLAPGDYGTFTGGVKAGIVTLQPQAGAAARMAVDLEQAQGIRFRDLTLGQTYMRDSPQIEFLDDTFTSMAQVDVTSAVRAPLGIRFAGNTFDGINECTGCQEGRLTVVGDDNAGPVGVTIEHNHFGGGGESDGVHITSGAYGVRVLDNEFEGIVQADYTLHVDPLQLYHSSHTVIAGNYFHGNTTGIMAADGANHEDIENNVFIPVTDGTGYPFTILLAGDDGSTVRHNTLVGGACDFGDNCGTLNMAVSNAGAPSVGTVIRDNVLSEIDYEGLSAPSTTDPEDHNLFGNASATILGAHDLTGTPVFFASTPATWSDYGLARGSSGAGAASDGLNMGIDMAPHAVWTAPAGARAGMPVALDGTASQGDGPVSCAWSFEKPDGTVLERASGCRITKGFATAGGTYARLTVTDRDGETDANRQSFAVAPGTAASKPPRRRAGFNRGRSKWVVVNLHRRFRVASCRGRVRVTVLSRHRRVAARTVRLSRTCGYRVRFKVLRSRLHGARQVTLRVRLVGDRAASPRTYRVSVRGR